MDTLSQQAGRDENYTGFEISGGWISPVQQLFLYVVLYN